MTNCIIIYYKSKKLVLSSNIELPEEGFEKIVPKAELNEVSNLLDLFVSDHFNGNIFIQCSGTKKVLKSIKKYFKVIKAAGGLVKNERNENLLIFRRGFWDLPKGKIEKYESKKKAAKREVNEETGVKKLKIDRFITTTYHIYDFNSNKILKVSHWYLMKTKGQQTLVPQTDEDIETAQWVQNANLNYYLSNAYNNIVEVFTKAHIKS